MLSPAMRVLGWISLAAAVAIRVPGGLPPPLAQLPPIGQLQVRHPITRPQHA